MITTKLPRTWILSLAALAACQLPPELLDAGDDGDTVGDGTVSDGAGTDDDTGGGDGDGDGENDEFECVLQGTNVHGGTDLMDWDVPLDECSVICAEGWGHDVPLLESEWTGEVEPHLWSTRPPTRVSLVLAPGGDVYLVASAPDDDYHTHHFQVDGTYAVRTGSALQDEILDAGMDDLGRHVWLWTDGVTQSLRWQSSLGDTRWDLELGPHHGYASRLVVVDDTAFVALDDGDHRLLRIDDDGNIEFDQPTPPTTCIEVSPSGDVLVLANDTSISWTNTQGQFLGAQAIQGELQAVLGIAALDDSRVAYVGYESAESPFNVRAIVRTHGAMGPGWSHSYDRADAWCVESDNKPTHEAFTGVVQLGDGSLMVIGNESRGVASPEYNSQPWVAHVSADGQVLAYDRGFWAGSAFDVVARGNIAYVLFATFDFDGSGHIGYPMVRKYVL